MKADSLDYRYDLTPSDLPEFAALPLNERRRIAELLVLMRDVARSCFGTAQAIRLVAGREGMPVSRLQRAWTRYTRAGDWRSLIDGRLRKATA